MQRIQTPGGAEIIIPEGVFVGSIESRLDEFSGTCIGELVHPSQNPFICIRGAWMKLSREEQELLDLKDMFRHWTWLERFKGILSTEWMVEKRKQLVLRACNRASEVRVQRMMPAWIR